MRERSRKKSRSDGRRLDSWPERAKEQRERKSKREQRTAWDDEMTGSAERERERAVTAGFVL